jgi:hypothetical protein
MNRRFRAVGVAAVVGAGTLSTYAPPAHAWRLAWREDFNHVPTRQLTTTCPATTPACLGPNMHAVTGSATDGHGQQRTLQAVRTSKGILTIDARNARPGEGPGRLTGGLVLENGPGRIRGAWEARVKYDPDPSYQATGNALTWPSEGCWPVAGENNFAETLWGMGSSGGVYYFVHAARYPNDLTASCGVQNSIWWQIPAHYRDGRGINPAAWHTYRLEHTTVAGRETVRFQIDGHQTAVWADNRIPHQWRHRLSLQTDTRDLGAPLNTRMLVDYVKVYNP